MTENLTNFVDVVFPFEARYSKLPKTHVSHLQLLLNKTFIITMIQTNKNCMNCNNPKIVKHQNENEHIKRQCRKLKSSNNKIRCLSNDSV